MQIIIDKLRNAIQDNLKTRNYNRTFYTSRIFLLEDANIESSTLVIERNGFPWDKENYIYNSNTGKVTIEEITGEEELVSGENLGFSYSCYEKYSNSVLKAYICSALYQLSVNKFKTFKTNSSNIIFPTPSEQEENLIVIVAAILIKGNVRSYRTSEFTITFGENLSIEDKIKKLIDELTVNFGRIDYIDLSESIAEED